MINKHINPVAWALLAYELEDAQEGIESLLKEMMTKGDAFDEIDFRIHLAHIYAHLNRAWNRRQLDDEAAKSEESLDEHSLFPTDIEPL